MVAELLWLELVWLFDWWAGIKVFQEPTLLGQSGCTYIALWVRYFKQKAVSKINSDLFILNFSTYPACINLFAISHAA